MNRLRRPNASTAACSLERLCQTCGALGAVAKASIGQRGCAVLMEMSGKVVITRDGSDIFKSLAVDDPVLSMAVSHILLFARERGDGSKTCILLLNRIISLFNHVFFSTNQTVFHQPAAASRGRAIRRLQSWRLQHLPDLQRLTVNQYCSATCVQCSKSSEVISSFLQSFLSLHFPKLVANKLRDLLEKMLQLNSLKNLLCNTVQHCLEQKMNLIFQVYRCPLRLSQVIEGFILSRDFKIEPQELMITERKILLWSLSLETEVDGTILADIATGNKDIFIMTSFRQSSRMHKLAEMLERLNIQLIVSSVVFPDWAVAALKQRNIAVVDMVCEEEFNFLSEQLRISPAVSATDLIDPKNHCIIGVGALHLGTSRYVHFKMATRQMVVAGPTATQCNQYCRALVASLKALHNWIHDSRDFVRESEGLEKFPGVHNSLDGNSHEVLIWCPSEGYIQCAAQLALEYSIKLSALNSPADSNFLSKIILEIFQILHSHTVAGSNRKFLAHFHEYSQQLKDSGLRERLTASAVAEHRLENPFQFFAALNSTFLLAESVFRINSIIDVKHIPNRNT